MNAARLAGWMLAALLLAGCTGDGTPGTEWDGRWLIVNYWAEWCKPCLEEIPELNEFAASNQETVTVVGVNYDGATGAELERLVDKFGIRFDVIEDPAARLGYPRPIVLPTTVVIDPQGKVANTLLGPQTLASLQAAITGSD